MYSRLLERCGCSDEPTDISSRVVLTTVAPRCVMLLFGSITATGASLLSTTVASLLVVSGVAEAIVFVLVSLSVTGGFVVIIAVAMVEVDTGIILLFFGFWILDRSFMRYQCDSQKARRNDDVVWPISDTPKYVNNPEKYEKFIYLFTGDSKTVLRWRVIPDPNVLSK